MVTSRSLPRSHALATVLCGVGLAGCVSSTPDPRCRIEAPPEYVGTLAKSVNGSKLWQAYFDGVSPSTAGAQPLIAVSLDLNRRVLKRRGGDYDPGKVDIEFTITLLKSSALLFEQEETVSLDSFIIGAFDGTETREEVQQAAFKATESRIFPYLDRWINIAAIRAMAHEGSLGTPFIAILEEQAKDPWSEQLMDEAKTALAEIRGS